MVMVTPLTVSRLLPSHSSTATLAHSRHAASSPYSRRHVQFSISRHGRSAQCQVADINDVQPSRAKSAPGRWTNQLNMVYELGQAKKKSEMRSGLGSSVAAYQRMPVR